MKLVNGNSTDDGRRFIAKIVTRFVLWTVVLILLSCLAILLFTCSKCDTDKGDVFTKYKDIIGIILPLLGTWLGTVLAYYFSQSNLDAASKNVNELVKAVGGDSKLKEIKANDPDLMIPFSKIIAYSYKGKEQMAGEKIKEILDFMTKNNVLRLPFIDNDKKLHYCIHRSIFDKFVSIESFRDPDAKPAAFTFAQFLTTDDDEIKKYIEQGCGFVKESATAYDAKYLMDNSAFCQDVFITSTGAKDQPVIGWITDTKVLEKSRV
ncbi:MAG TPA: hypothetical protein VIM55_16645 [Mucilaginibacter sp.]